MAAPTITIKIKETRDVNQLLKKLPIDVRHIALRKALRNAATIFSKEVRRKAGRLNGTSYNRPSWGRNKTPGDLSKSIASPKSRRRGVPDHIIKVRVTTKGEANKYAAMAEYGHDKFIFGKPYLGDNEQKTPPVGFWRSTTDETRTAVDARIKQLLRDEIRKLINA